MRLDALNILAYREHDPDPPGEVPVPFDGSVALRLLPGDCSLALVAVFKPEADDRGPSHPVPWIFVTHAEEDGAVAYATTRLAAHTSERADDGSQVVAFYDLPFRPARAGDHALLVEVADGGRIESHDWMVRVRQTYRA